MDAPKLAPIDRYLALPSGLTYHLLEWPHPSSDTTILLVHGFLDLAWGWRWVAEELARRYHVVAPDLRGHGDSDWIGSGGYYYFFDYLADLDHVIARTRRRQLVIAGHSMGGSVASYWVGARAGHRDIAPPLGLAVLEGLGPPESGDQPATRLGPWIDQWARLRRQAPRPMASLQDAAQRLRHHDPLLPEALAVELAARGTRRHGDGWVWKHDPLHASAGPFPFRVEIAAGLWERIACPVLLVDASESTLRLPERDVAERRAAFRDVRSATIARAGHMMQRHQPAEVARLITELAGGR